MTSSSSSLPPTEPRPVPQAEESSIVVARAGQYYRNTRYIMTVILVGMGLWFGYDGFIGWPNLNQRIQELTAQREQALRNGDSATANTILQELGKLGKVKTDSDLKLQKVLCFALPPLAVVLLLRALHNSRGEYRLEGTTLQVPGHPTVPFENITEIDRRLWEKKGIAYISYDLGDGRQGKLRLDDFVYESAPTREIFKRIENYVEPASEQKSDADDADDDDEGDDADSR